MGNSEEGKNQGKVTDLWLSLLTSLFKELGLPGFITVIVTFVFLFWGSAEQKREFIDTFILLKNQNPFPCVIIIVSLIAVLLISTFFYRKMLKLRKEENNRIGEEKSKLQSELLNKKLRSSK